jgi:hypothetical protein
MARAEVAVRGLNFRTGPGMQFRVIRVLRKGETLRLTGERKGPWIRGIDAASVAGWVHSAYVRVFEDTGDEQNPCYGIDAWMSRIDFAKAAASPRRPRVFVQSLWSGGSVPSVAPDNLSAARAAGWTIAGYLVPYVIPPRSQTRVPNGLDPIRAALDRIGEDLFRALRFMAVDIERIAGSKEATLAAAADMLHELERLGARPVIYTGRWFWVGYLGNPRDPFWARYPLWLALYDAVEEIPDRAGFGPADWRVFGKQFAGTTVEDFGVVDWNIFDLRRLG